jgi:glycosyltransferase involved in cell wall biosynthesis
VAVPSRTTRTWAEQFGRVLVEAMLCGRPVVGYESGEIGWVIRTAGGGLVVPEGDVGALAAALARLQHSPGERAELAARGIEGARRHFSPHAAADALEDLLTGRAGT